MVGVGAEPQGEALLHQVGQERVLTLVAEKVAKIFKGLGPVLLLGVWKRGPHDGEHILVLDGDELENLTETICSEGLERLIQLSWRHTLIWYPSKHFTDPALHSLQTLVC